jgi:hypothetical protein
LGIGIALFRVLSNFGNWLDRVLFGVGTHGNKLEKPRSSSFSAQGH